MTADPGDDWRQLYSSRIITINPGPSSHESDRSTKSAITIHEGVLRKHSPFFRAALDQHWNEGGTGVIEMPEDNHETLAAYVNWLYTKIVPPCPENRPGFYILPRLYVLGEKIQDDRFCDEVLHVITTIVDKHRMAPNSSQINGIYEGTPPTSPMRKLLVEIYAARADEKFFDDTGLFHAEFMHDLVRRLIQQRTKIQRSWCDERHTWYKQK